MVDMQNVLDKNAWQCIVLLRQSVEVQSSCERAESHPTSSRLFTLMGGMDSIQVDF